MRLTTLYDNSKADWCPWTRYWSEWASDSADTNPWYGAPEGYLWRPERGRFTRAGRKPYLTLAAIADVTCAVLLGDSGSGKSATLAQHASTVDARRASTGDALMTFEAREIQTRADVISWLASNEIAEWRAGTHLPHVMIDGLDESTFGPADFVDVIAEEMERWPITRLRLRLTLQSTVYRGSIRKALNTALEKAHGAHVVTQSDAGAATQDTAAPTTLVLLLEGLQYVDTEAFALKRLGEQGKVDAFLKAVEAASAEPFAALPLTLGALLEQYAQTGKLQARVPELYATLCEVLCQPRGKAGSHKAAQTSRKNRREWMHIAAGVCAAVVFSRRGGLWHAPARPSDEYIGVDEFLGSDIRPFGDVRPTRDDLAALASSALFTVDIRQPEHAVVVTKAVYAEFLTAVWIIEAELSPEQTIQLLGGGDARALPVLPHLRGVATWLASLSERMARELIAVDPESTIWHERADLPPSIRATLIDTLVRRAAANSLRRPEFGFWRSLARLKHDSLADQLTATIQDIEQPEDAKHLALDVAQSAGVSGVEDIVTTLALDMQTSRELRSEAARTVAYVGGRRNRTKLQTLACEEDADDDEQLRGAALLAAWQTLTPDRLFAAIRPRRRDSFYGSYASAVSSVASGLEKRHALSALDWLSRQHREGKSIDSGLNNAVVSLAIKCSEANSKIRRRLADVVVECAIAHEALWRSTTYGDTPEGQQFLRDESKLRQALLRSLVDALAVALGRSDAECDFDRVPRWSASFVAFSVLGVRFGVDEIVTLSSIVLRSERASPVSRSALAILAAHVTFDDAEHTGVLWPYRADTRFLDLFAHFPIEAGTPDAAIRELRLRRDEQERAYEAETGARQRALTARTSQSEHESAKGHAKAHSVSNNMRARVLAASSAAESPDWARMCAAVWGGADRFDRPTDVALHETKSLSLPQRQRIADCSLAFLESCPKVELSDHSGGSLPTVGHRGCSALLTAAHFAKRRLNALSPETIQTWMPVWLRCHYHDSEISSVFDAALSHVAQLRGIDLASLITGLLITESVQIEESGAPVGPTYNEANIRRLSTLVTRGGLTSIIDERLVAVLGASAPLRDAAVDATCTLLLGPRVADTVIECLRDLGQFEGIRSILRRATADERGKTILAIACAGAIRCADIALRLEAISLLKQNQRVAEDALWWLANGPQQTSGIDLTTWSEGELDTLYRLHLSTFPPERRDTDNRSRNDELVAALCSTYAKRGTYNAVKGWVQLVEDMPDRRWLARYRFDAEVAFSNRVAAPVAASALWELRRSRDQRLVRTEAELLQLVVTALQRFETELHGETGAIETLWDRQRPERLRGDTRRQSEWIPKDENSLSDTLVRALRQSLRGLSPSIAREPEIRRPIVGAAKGQRTDIDISVVLHDPRAKQLRVVVEVKGSWHPDVETAMPSQLVKRYLRQNGLSTGLYLVGYFASPRWSGAQATKSAKLGSLDELRRRLAAQASAHSLGQITLTSMVLDCRLGQLESEGSKSSSPYRLP